MTQLKEKVIALAGRIVHFNPFHIIVNNDLVPMHHGKMPKLLEVNKKEASQFVLELSKVVDYNPYPFDEILLMVSAFCFHRPDVVLDLGTHEGKSARIWYELSRRYSTQTSIHTVDIMDPKHPEFPGKRHGSFISGLSVHQHIGDSYECALELIQRNPDATYLLFLDADHRFESVRRELNLLNQIKHGAALIHDTFYQPDSTYNQGPYLAIVDFLKENRVKQVIHLQTGLPGVSYVGL